MSGSKKYLSILVGRGGSKSVVGKNLKFIGGHSLMEYKVRAVQLSNLDTRIIVSTDCEQIADMARAAGAEVLFMRPNELATDTSSISDALLHALDWMKENEGETYDGFLLLQPTAPFATPEDFNKAAELFEQREASAVMSVREAPIPSVFQGLIEDGKISSIAERVKQMRSYNRQNIQQEYTMNGAIFICDTEMFMREKSLYGDPERTYAHMMPKEYSVDIDDPIDLAFAEHLVSSGQIDLAKWGW